MEVHGALDVVGEQGMDHERKAELHGRWRFGEGSSGSVKGLNMMLPDLKPLPSAEEGAADAPASGHVGAGGGEAAEAAEAADAAGEARDGAEGAPAGGAGRASAEAAGLKLAAARREALRNVAAAPACGSFRGGLARLTAVKRWRV